MKEDQKYVSLLNQYRNVLYNHNEKVLGELDHGNVVLFYPKDIKDNKKRILIISGMHGDETAGPYAILEFCRANKNLLDQINVSIIPIVNIYGFINGSHGGETNSAPNWFLNKDGQPHKLGREAQILEDNIELLRRVSKDGLLNVHEDQKASGFYLYVLGDPNSRIIDAMKKSGEKYLPIMPNGVYYGNGEYEVKNGIVDNYHDGSFDDMMQKRFQIPLLITSETPMKKDMRERINCNVAMINAFTRAIWTIQK